MNSSYQVRQKCVGDVSFLRLQRAPTVNYPQPLTLIGDTQNKKFSWVFVRFPGMRFVL